MATKDTTIGASGEAKIAPSRVYFPVTPGDSADNITEGDVAYTTRAISFATAGAVKVTRPDGTAVMIPSGALAAGVMHSIQCVRIWSTGTTAANFMAWI
jgi:hypothetical protein